MGVFAVSTMGYRALPSEHLDSTTEEIQLG
jgi:hypothetical protein